MNKKNTNATRGAASSEGHDQAWATYAARLNWAMHRTGKTNQSELARAVGVKPQSIQYLCDPHGGAQGSSHTPSLARELGVSAEWLATGLGSPNVAPPRASGELGAFNTKETAPGYAANPPKIEARVPVRHAARLSGHGDIERMEGPADDAIDLQSLPLFAQPPRVAAMRIKGNALSPWAKDGQFLLTEPAPETLAAEDLLLIRMHDGRLLIRELMVVRPDSLLVLPVLGGQPEAIERQDIAGVDLVVCVLPRRYGHPGV